MGLSYAARERASKRIPYLIEKLEKDPNYNIGTAINSNSNGNYTDRLLTDKEFTKNLLVSIDSAPNDLFDKKPVLTTILSHLAVETDDYENHRNNDTTYAARQLASQGTLRDGCFKNVVMPLIEEYNSGKHAWKITELHCCGKQGKTTIYLN